MNVLAAIVGYLALAAVCLLVGAVAIAWVRAVILHWEQDCRYRGAMDAGNSVVSLSWWFENPDAREAVRIVGEHLTHFGHVNDADKIRDAWREVRGAKVGTAGTL